MKKLFLPGPRFFPVLVSSIFPLLIDSLAVDYLSYSYYTLCIIVVIIVIIITPYILHILLLLPFPHLLFSSRLTTENAVSYYYLSLLYNLDRSQFCPALPCPAWPPPVQPQIEFILTIALFPIVFDSCGFLCGDSHRFHMFHLGFGTRERVKTTPQTRNQAGIGDNQYGKTSIRHELSLRT